MGGAQSAKVKVNTEEMVKNGQKRPKMMKKRKKKRENEKK